MKLDATMPRSLRLAKALGPNRWIKALSGAAVLWLVLPDESTSASRIHAAFRREAWRKDGAAGKLVLATGFLAWLPTTLILAVGCTRRCGARVAEQTGKSRLRQLREQLVLAATMAVPPPWYYVFEFHDDARRRLAKDYLYRFETKAGLYDFLRENLSGAETTAALSDKAAFVTRCRAHSVPVVDALATITDGRLERFDDGVGAVPHRNLFLKPIRGAGGRGAERWMRDAEGRFHGGGDHVLGEDEMLAHLVELSNAEPYVVRAHVTNHSGIADLSPGALSTVRVVTCLDEGGDPVVTHAVLRMARTAESVVDNFHAGGIAAMVDLQTGRLGRATNMGMTADAAWWESHPLTGATIVGRRVPDWSRVMDVARQAHAAFADQVAVGWDIALLEDGPHLVEGNKSPDLDIIQRCHAGPIGNSRFGDLLLHYVGIARAKRDGREPALSSRPLGGSRSQATVSELGGLPLAPLPPVAGMAKRRVDTGAVGRR